MAEQQITYAGPPSAALAVARAVAEAEGVELVGSQRLPTDDPDVAVLVLAVEGSSDDIIDAVASVRADLPDGATLKIGR